MATKLKENLDPTIGLPADRKWTKQHHVGVHEFILQRAAKRSPERVLKNRLLAVRYQMEAYLQENDPAKRMNIEDFVLAYLQALNMPFRKFALAIDSSDGNLKKYVTGERKFNTDLALRFAHFFHTPAELWLKVSVKNDLLAVTSNKNTINKYKKYDYKKAVEV